MLSRRLADGVVAAVAMSFPVGLAAVAIALR